MRKVFIVDGLRTPYLKAPFTTGPFSASDLAVAAGRELLARQPFNANQIDEVILGCVMPSAFEANIGRLVALRIGCGDKVPAFTVQRNCASGMQALDSAAKNIALGRSEIVVAGGTESMSQAPLMWSRSLRNWFATFMSEKELINRLALLLKFPITELAPVIALKCGLNDPIVNLSMGQTAENLAAMFNITRQQMDEFSLVSHQRAAAAKQNGHLTEMITLYDTAGKIYDQDTGVRADSTLEKLAKLKPAFDPKFGNITPGNSSQVTDGATMLVLASEEAVKKYKLPTLACIVDSEWAALSQAHMGLGPVMASTPMLMRHQYSPKDVDFWEINEAFAAQVLACQAAWRDEKFCKDHFGLSKAFGEVSHEQLNVDGGGVAIGHPVGSSGARIVLHLCHVLQREKAKRGVASICIGGGQGGAMLIERT
jgi:acetyl-CoA C-acetyltransferase